MIKSIRYLVIGMALCMFTVQGWAQQATAELVATIKPMKLDGKLPLEDGFRHVFIQGHTLYLTNYWAGVQIVNVQDPAAPQNLTFIPLENESYESAVGNNFLFVANDESGVAVFNVADPQNPRPVGMIDLPGKAIALEISFPHLFVALGDNGFAIVDVADPQNPNVLALEINGSWIEHVAVEDSKLYAAAKKDGVLIYDISNPEEPQQLGKYATGFQAMDINVDDHTLYVADGGGGLLLLDVTNPRLPRVIKRIKTKGFVLNLAKSGNYVYLANRLLGLLIVNVENPEAAFLAGTYKTESTCYAAVKQDEFVYVADDREGLILRHNTRPVLTDIPDMTLKEGEPFTLTIEARDPDGDPLSYRAFHLPEGATFDTVTHVFSWTPTYEQSGVYPGVVFQVTERTQSRLSVADTVTFTVEHVNRLPDLPAIADTTIDENTTLTIVIPEGSDPDKEDQGRLTYRAENLPQGATFDPTTRTFTWTPTYEQSGVYVVDFILDDGAGGVDREAVTITVRHVDRPPVIAKIPDQTVDEGQLLTINVTGEDPDKEDQDKISFKMENLPEGATFDPTTQTFSWTPNYDQSGVYSGIRAIMIAGKLSDTTTFTITVNHVNRPPVMAEVAPQTVKETETLTFTVSGSDPDKEDAGKLTFYATNLPDGATFDAATQTFSWTPTYEQAGTYTVTFGVKDPAGLTDETQTTITVENVNRPPVLAEVGTIQGKENETITFTLSASDPDKEDAGKLTFRAENMPDGATLDSKSGVFQWVPTYEQAGTYTPVFIVSDGDLSDSSQATIVVENVNRPPVIAEIGPQEVDENSPLKFTVQASDPDKEDAGKLQLSASALPEGATFDPATGQFQWTPTFEQAGEYTVTFTVQDAEGATASQSVTITVHNVNRPPQLAEIAPQTVKENEPLTVTFTATDPDNEDAGKLTFQATPMPEGAQLDAASGQFQWTPNFEQAGKYDLTVTVRDPGGATDSKPFTITVENVNRPPAISVKSEYKVKEGEPLEFTVAGNDPDAGDKLTFSASGLPPGATFDAASGVFRWTPGSNDQGSYTVEFAVKDAAGASATATVTIVVEDVPQPEGENKPQ